MALEASGNALLGTGCSCGLGTFGVGKADLGEGTAWSPTTLRQNEG